MLKSAIFAAIISLASTTPSLAQSIDQERLTLARNYLAIVQNDATITNMVRQNSELIVHQIKARKPDLGIRTETRIRGILETQLFSAVKKANEGLDAIIAQQFTTHELQALRIFAESETGRSVLNKLPQLSVAMQPKLQKAVEDSMAKISEELLKEGIALTR